MQRKALFVLFGTLLLDTITVGILFPIIPILFTDASKPAFMLAGYSVSMQYFVVGAIGAIYGLMQFIAAPLLGELSDIYGRKRLLTLCVGLLAVANLLFGFGITVASLSVLFFSRLVAGFAGANFAIAQATIADVSKPEDRAKNFGLIGAAFGVGFILGPLLGGWIAGATGNAAAPFWFAGMLGILNLIFISLFLPETHHERKEVTSRFNLLIGINNIRAAFRDRDAAPVYWTSFLYMCGFTFFTTFISVLLSVKYAFSEAQIGTFFGVVGLCIVITQVGILRYVSKRWSERTAMLFGFPVVAFCIFAYPFAHSVWFLYLLVPLMAVPQGLAFANLGALISKSVSKDKQGAALGINGSLIALAQGIIPLAAGVGTSFVGLTAPFAVGALFIMSAWYVLFNFRRSV